MSKRFLSAAVAVLLFLTLSSCGEGGLRPDKVSPAASPSPSAKTTPSPSPTAEPNYGGVLLPGGNFPDAGYSPLPAPERYYPGNAGDLIPSDDYGPIYPYIGGFISLNWMSSELYGMCDGDGKIICDPVYNKAEVIDVPEGRMYMLTRFISYNESRITLCAMDGSWAETYEDVIYREDYFYEENDMGIMDIWRTLVRYDYITAKKDGKWGVIDYTGKVLLPFEYDEQLCFHDGLATYMADEETAYCIDITGKTVFGPFAPMPSIIDPWTDFHPTSFANAIIFHEGYARFYHNGKYGMINKSGDVVIPAEYKYLSHFKGGIAKFAYPDSDQFGLINKNNEIILEPTSDNLFNMNGTAIILDSKTHKHYAISFDGSKTDYTLPSFDGDLLPNGNRISYNDRSETWTLYLPNDSPLAGTDGNAIEYPGIPGMFTFGGETYIFSYRYDLKPTSGNHLFEVYDIDGQKILPDMLYSCLSVDGMFAVRSGQHAGLMDSGGNWILQVSILEYLDD